MSVDSLEFLLAFLIVSSFFFLLPTPGLRKLLFSLCNEAFVISCLPNLASVLMVALFALSGYIVARMLLRHPRGPVLSCYLIVLVSAFLIIKKYDFLYAVLPSGLLNHPLGVAGLSYMLFRQIHFLVDVSQDQIERFSLYSYLNYQFNLFGYLSGPIQRYQEFGSLWADMKPLLRSRHQVLSAYLRIMVGYIKVSLVSTFCMAKFTLWREHLAAGSIADIPMSRLQALKAFAFVFYSYPLFLYFNFSGYCDIVIAAAALLGIELPENFDQPYLSRNMIDYWTRFHRSLGFWIRDYLFTPLYMAVGSRWNTFTHILVYPCYLIAFVLAGVWHGSTANFAIFGLLQGIGASSVKLWETILISRIGRKGLKKYNSSRAIRFVATLITLHFAAFTYLFFPTDLNVTMKVFRNMVKLLHH